MPFLLASSFGKFKLRSIFSSMFLILVHYKSVSSLSWEGIWSQFWPVFLQRALNRTENAYMVVHKVVLCWHRYTVHNCHTKVQLPIISWQQKVVDDLMDHPVFGSHISCHTSSSSALAGRWPSPEPIREPPPKVDESSSSIHHRHDNNNSTAQQSSISPHPFLPIPF